MADAEFSAAEKLKCAEREVSQRRRVYPRLIDSGRLSVNEARRQIACMEAIAEDYRAQVSAEKPDLFAAGGARG